MIDEPFCVQLISLCRAEPARAKWVVVPSPAIGHTLGERLALGGSSWVNLRFVTPLGLAVETAGPFLVEAGLDPLPEGLGPSLVMRLLLDLPPETPPYFRPLADRPSLGAALWKAIRDLRMAGLAAADLPASAFGNADKHVELQALMTAYEAHLLATRCADAADVFRAAASHAAAAPVGAADLVVESGTGTAPPLVRAFLDALPGCRVPRDAPAIPGLDRLRRADGPSCRVVPPSSRLAFLIRPGDTPPGLSEPAIELFHAAGREAEVEAVLRRALSGAETLALDQVEVACASREYAHLCWEKSQRLGLPVTVEQGVPVAVCRPARAVLSLCDWIDSGFVAGRLRRLLQSGDLSVELPGGAGGGQAARLLARAGATWGRDTYERSLTALAAREEERAAADTDLSEQERAAARVRAAQAGHLRRWAADLLAAVPVPDARGDVSLADVVAGLAAVLAGRVAASGSLDADAAAALRRAFADLRGLGDLRRPMRQVTAIVRETVATLTVRASRARPGHLHVSALASAGWGGRPRTFVVGLQEGVVFPSLVEDPVLLDDERRRISPALATSHDRLAEAVHAVMSRLAVLPAGAAERRGGGGDVVVGAANAGRVCFSASCRDLDDNRETFPSWLLLQALRLGRRQPALTYDDLRDALGTPETQVPGTPGEALTDAGWWLAALARGGARDESPVLHAFPSLAAGRAAAAARESARFTEWDGLVPAARAVLDPRVSGEPASATRLERFAACPFRTLLEHGLGVAALEDDDPDRDEWLDAMQKGAALHEVYAALGREARARGARLDPRRDGFRARLLADDTLARMRAVAPPPSDVVFDRERAEFQRDVALFLEFEAGRAPSEPVAFEVSFGGAVDGVEPLARADAVTVSLGDGESFRLRGSIDRIDRLPDGAYEVIDYKTGSFVRDRYRGTFSGGTLLQHALYGVAASALIGRVTVRPRITHGVYEFPSARGGGERVTIPRPGDAALAAVLSDLFDTVAAGAFVAAGDEYVCRYCEFARACGDSRVRADAKTGNPDNRMLEPFARLKAHE